MLENLQLAASSASLPDPAKQQLLHCILTLSRVEGFDMKWIEAISEADRIRNQFPRLQ